VWTTEPSPKDRSLVITASHRKDNTKAVTLYKLVGELNVDSPIEDESRHHSYGDVLELEKISRFSYRHESTFVQSIKWHSTRDTVATLDPHNLSLWNLRESDITVSNSRSALSRNHPPHSNPERLN
jgi:hypothetical protein